MCRCPWKDTRRGPRDYGLPASYILCVGTIQGPRENITGLLHAFAILQHTYGAPDAVLALAGGAGWLYDEVTETVARLGLKDTVRFLGRVNDDSAAQALRRRALHVHPAYYEGFGLPPLEMACGTPTIVSNVSSLPEVVQDAALLVDPNNHEEIAVAMNRLLTDDKLHAEIREKGLQTRPLLQFVTRRRGDP